MKTQTFNGEHLVLPTNATVCRTQAKSNAESGPLNAISDTEEEAAVQAAQEEKHRETCQAEQQAAEEDAAKMGSPPSQSMDDETHEG